MEVKALSTSPVVWHLCEDRGVGQEPIQQPSLFQHLPRGAPDSMKAVMVKRAHERLYFSPLSHVLGGGVTLSISESAVQ